MAKYKGTTGLVTEPITSDYHKIPAVTTTQRDALTAVVGMLIYNSTIGMMQQYNAAGWASIASNPIVSSISPTTASETGDSIVITGSNFSTTVIVKIIGNDATEYDPASTTRNSSTQITITRAANITVANEPYDIKVTNTSGLTATLENALDAGGSPSWTTFLAGLTGSGQATSGRIATITDLATGTHDTLAATDPDGDTITYSIVGTDTWAAQNIATNTSTGVVSGDPTNQAADTTYTNTVRATDTGGNTTDQSLNIIVTKALDGSSSGRAVRGPKDLSDLSISTSAVYWYAVPSYNSGNAFQAYTDFSIDQGHPILVFYQNLFVGGEADLHPASNQSAVGTAGFNMDGKLANCGTLLTNVYRSGYNSRLYAGMGEASGSTLNTRGNRQWLGFTDRSGTGWATMFGTTLAQGAYTGSGCRRSDGTTNGSYYMTSGHGTSSGVQQCNGASSGTTNSNVIIEFATGGGGEADHAWSVWGNAGGNYYNNNHIGSTTRYGWMGYSES